MAPLKTVGKIVLHSVLGILLYDLYICKLFDISLSSYQGNQVPGVFAAEVSTAAEDYQSDEEDCIGNIVRPRINSNKHLGIIDKGEDGNKGKCDHKLHCENHEDLVGKFWQNVKNAHYVKWIYCEITTDSYYQNNTLLPLNSAI